MKRFIATELFLSLKNASQNGIDMDATVLENDYDAFAMLVFSEMALPRNKAEIHSALCYTRVELFVLRRDSRALKKKCGLSWQSHHACRSANQADMRTDAGGAKCRRLSA